MCRLAFLARSLADPVVKVKLEIRGSTVAPAYGDAFEQRVVEEFSLWNEFGKSQKIV